MSLTSNLTIEQIKKWTDEEFKSFRILLWKEKREYYKPELPPDDFMKNKDFLAGTIRKKLLRKHEEQKKAAAKTSEAVATDQKVGEK